MSRISRPYRRERFNPLDWINANNWPSSHITYDPDVVKQYSVIRTVRHDGTLLFTHDLFTNVVKHLVQRQSYFNDGSIVSTDAVMRGMRYVVGDMVMTTLFGRVTVPIGEIDGERQRIRMPVRCIPPSAEEIAAYVPFVPKQAPTPTSERMQPRLPIRNNEWVWGEGGGVIGCAQGDRAFNTNGDYVGRWPDPDRRIDWSLPLMKL